MPDEFGSPSRGYNMGTSERRFVQMKSSQVGPGSYRVTTNDISEQAKKTKDGPYLTEQRFKDKKEDDVDFHDLPDEFGNASGGYSMSQSKRFDSRTGSNVGPGAYNPNAYDISEKTKKIQDGPYLTEQRFVYTKGETVPGPG